MKRYKLYNKLYNKWCKMKKLTKIEILFFIIYIKYITLIIHCLSFKMDTLFEYYNPKADTAAIKCTDGCEFMYFEYVYPVATFGPLIIPQQPQQLPIFVPNKHFKNVVGQNIGTSYVNFLAVVENVLSTLNLPPYEKAQHKAFADARYRQKNPNA